MKPPEAAPNSGNARKRIAERIAVTVVLAGFMVVTALVLLGTHREPEYQGRSLSQWLAHTSSVQVIPMRNATGVGNVTFTVIRMVHVPDAQFTLLGPNPSLLNPLSLGRSESLREALRVMGDAATPHLIDLLSRKDSSFPSRVNSLLDRQRLIKFRMEQPVPARLKALIAFHQLGTNGNSAVPQLARLATKEAHASAACTALSYVNTPDAKAAIRATLANNRGVVRTRAALGLGISIPETDEPMDLLTLYSLALHPTNRLGHIGAIHALGAIGEPPEIIVRLLIPCLTHEYGSLERLAALREIGQSGANVRQYQEAIRQAMGEDRGQPGSYQEDLHRLLERLLTRPAQ